MDFQIASAVLHDLRAAVTAAAPREACGLLLGVGRCVLEARPAGNLSDRPETRFDIDPRVLFAAHRAARDGGLAILGCYHSHPASKAWPSPRDAAQAYDLGWLWLIAGTDRVAAFVVEEDGPIHGRFAPATLTALD